MDLRNCSRCGNLFAYTGRNICNKCLNQEEEEYTIVRKYVRDHAGASVIEVSEATGVEEEKILQFIRDGRLKSQGFTGVLACERCGKSINTGRFCVACMQQRDKEIRGALRNVTPEQTQEVPKRKTNDKLHILGRDEE